MKHGQDMFLRGELVCHYNIKHKHIHLNKCILIHPRGTLPSPLASTWKKKSCGCLVSAIHFKVKNIFKILLETNHDLTVHFALFNIHYNDIHYLQAHQSLSNENMFKLVCSKWVGFTGYWLLTEPQCPDILTPADKLGILKTGHMIAVPQASNISALGGMSAKISHSVQHGHATNASYFCFYRALKVDELKLKIITNVV